MIHALRRRSAIILIAIVVLSGGIVRWLPAEEPNDAAGVRIEYRAQVGELYYYVIENVIIDDVAIYTQQFRLPSTTTFRDGRTIVQSVLPHAQPATQPARPHLPPAAAPAPRDSVLNLEWACDRYWASERVTDMKEVAFDSLKHTYPPRELSGLARVPRSRTTFNFDGQTGAVSTIVVTPGTGSHPTDSRQSKTAERGLVTTENMQELLYAMGEQFLPNGPKRVGDQWTIKRVKPQPPFGTVTTDTTCTLKSIQKSGDADIALIDLTSVIHFEPSPVKPPPPAQPPVPPRLPPVATTRPVTSAPRYHPNPATARRVPTTRPAVRFPTQPKGGAKAQVRTPVVPPKNPPAPTPDHIQMPQVRSAPPTTAGAPSPTSQPTTSTTSKPTSQAAVTSPPKNSEDPFKMETALFKGTIKFDVTHGRLVEMTLVRNGSFVKLMRSDKEEMKIKQGSAHTLRIKGSVTTPPRPVIPGGPKPPVETPTPNARPVPPVTTQPAVRAATQPGMIHGATTQRATLTTRPAMPHVSGPTTRPGFATTPNDPRGIAATSRPASR